MVDDADFIPQTIIKQVLFKMAQFCKWMEGEDLHYLKEALQMMLPYFSKEKLTQILFPNAVDKELVYRKFKKYLKESYSYTDQLHYYCAIQKNNNKLSDMQLEEKGQLLKRYSRPCEFMLRLYYKLLANSEFGKWTIQEDMLQAPIGRPSEYKKPNMPVWQTPPPRVMM